ncbi:hypothetical protein DH2020_028103 [Rehmannia glutinosa]|uniref:CCD97-like C-terminal domain-containing protein n=1 Tax=Rehmannia glutinosa TaxID=99300 RepID=A0ABR0VSE3_REHGL
MAKSACGTIGSEAKESITERLSRIDDLYFPRKEQSSAAGDPSHRKSLLLDLLSTDAAVFLERYGSKLSLDELNQFDALKDDYEVNWHLNHLRSIINPTEEDKKSRSARVKNRRLAYMDKLILEGSYFSEDAMREREPYLHHEYVGKFQDQSGRNMARPGERWSETLMRRSEEAVLLMKIRGEQQRLGVAQSDWVGNEEIEEEEEDESETEEIAVVEPEANSLLSEEMQDRIDQFTHIMQQKFLSGEDHQHLDYTKIDEDETLDDHWMKEASQDAEEKYFDDI